jgi:Zn-dependent alcohol dehydrogenase
MTVRTEPQAGEVLVRVQAASVCHSDLHYMTGDLTCRLPAILGHEGTGITEQVGPGVRGVQAGDAVVLMWRPRCGRCEFCLTGRSALCAAIKVPVATGGLLDGTSRLSLSDGRQVHHFLGVSCFAEYYVVAQESMVTIPPQTPPRIAALAGWDAGRGGWRGSRCRTAQGTTGPLLSGRSRVRVAVGAHVIRPGQRQSRQTG